MNRRAVPSSRSAALAAALSLLLAGVAGLAAGGCRSEKDAAADAPPPAVLLGPADVVTAAIGRVQSGPTLSGDLTPLREATIRARIGGAVLETLAESGERVSGGELLARLDTAALRDARRSAQSAVAEVRSRLEQAEREQRRQEVLLEAGAVAERAVEQAAQTVVAARAALASARAQLSSAEEQLGYAEVRAPFAGVVSAKLASAGDVVQPGAELYRVVDPSSLELAALVATSDLGQLAIGAPVEFAVNGFPGRTFRGALTRIDPTADPATRQVRVYAELPNAGGELVGGLFAEGRVASESRQGITVPATAIDRRMGRPAVLRVRANRVERVEVALGLVDERAERVEVRQGVAPRDLLLVGAAQQLAPGTLVQIDRAPAAEQRAGG
jgi:membrane fusion protein, multidrug efflux system